MSDSPDAASAAVSSSPTATRTAAPALVNSIYVWLALLMIGMAVVGFWKSYFGPLVYGTLDMHWVIDLHAVVFSGWLLLFLGQAVLGARGYLRLHQSIGLRLGTVWGTVLVAVGVVVMFAVIVPGIGDDNHTPRAFAQNLAAAGGDLITFAILCGSGILYRNRPEVHKRLMVLATVALMGAPVGRLSGSVGGGFLGFITFYVGTRLFPAFLALGYDRWSRGRVHPAYWLGMALLLLNASRILMVRTEAWQTVSTWVLHRMRPVAEALLGG